MHLVRTLALTLALGPLALAADLRVEVAGSIAPGQSVTRITGDPGRAFNLYISATESPTPISELITLDVNPIRQFAAGVVLAGVLNGAGQATFAFTTTESLIGGRLTFQAASGRPTTQVSNLCRAQYLAPNTFGALPAATVTFLGDTFPLPEGRVLLLGGSGPIAQIYDVCRQEVSLGGLLPSANVFETRVQLADGRVLVCGGLTTSGQPVADAYLFDAATGTATPLPPLGTPRAGAAGALLPNGKVLVTGGLSAIDLTDPLSFFNAILGTTELFDPVAGTFSAGPAMPEPKVFHTATLMNNGQVLVAGGLGIAPIVNLPFVSNFAYTYSSGSNSFGLLPKLFTNGRLLHTATKLADGRVLLVGGVTADLTGVLETGDITQIAFLAVDNSPLYTTSGFGSFSNGPALPEGRALHTATRLANGRVLVAGGFTGTIDLGAILSGTIELPTPLATSVLLTASAVRTGPDMAFARLGGSAAATSDGRAVLFGGGPVAIEAYQP
jgi:hypothetical protein